jgi:prepilin-type N-terminal cleavage/methylation domain-containing protein
MNRMRVQPRGFTLIELLVAISVSVVLLSILAFVFKISTSATRDASSRVALTERLRTLNIRLRQEIGAMLPVRRVDAAGKPYPDLRTFAISPTGDWITFSTSTQENGRPISVDVRYELVPDPNDPSGTTMALVRRRDKTGPYTQNPMTLVWTANPKYRLGDDNGANSWETLGRADVMVTNVLNCKFEATDFDIPPGMEGAVGGAPKVAPGAATMLAPRELPAAIKLTIEFRAEVGNPDMTQDSVMVFPVYRGL